MLAFVFNMVFPQVTAFNLRYHGVQAIELKCCLQSLLYWNAFQDSVCLSLVMPREIWDLWENYFSLMPTSFWTVTHLSTTVILNQTISIWLKFRLTVLIQGFYKKQIKVILIRTPPFSEAKLIGRAKIISNLRTVV